MRKSSGQFAIGKEDKNNIMLPKQDLTEIAGRCSKATFGPWKSFVEGRDKNGSDFIQTPYGDIGLIGGTKAYQDFIARLTSKIAHLKFATTH